MTAQPSWRGALAGLMLLLICLSGGCTTIRIVDPPSTADKDFLLTGAVEQAVNQLSVDALRDRLVYVDTSWLIPWQQSGFAVEQLASNPTSGSNIIQTAPPQQPSLEHLFLVGELRAKLLKSGVRLVPTREKAQVVLEVRAGALSTNHLEFLLGLPASLIPSSITSSVTGGSSVSTPELSILKSTKQYGFASVAFVAFWADSGELLSVSGPFVGRANREDYWIFGTGPRTTGSIPPAQK